MAQFMLLMRGAAMEYLAYSPEEIQQAIQKYEDWARRLIQQGHLRGGDKLRDDGGRLVNNQNGQIMVDGPFAETKETISPKTLPSAGSWRRSSRSVVDSAVSGQRAA